MAADVQRPVTAIGPVRWIRKNLFNNWYNSLLTVISLYFILRLVIGFAGHGDARVFRPGDRLTTCQILHSVSDMKKTKLGIGRFWAIEVRYTNQRKELVAKEMYTGYGYRRVEG